VVNEVRLLGYLQVTPRLSHTPNGTAYTLLYVATERSWKDADGQRHTEREVHPVQVWRNLAEACCQYLKVNQLVYIEGRLHTREREDEHGMKLFIIAVVAEQVKFLPHYQKPAA
jgi:single-strand DNA-binding protein